MAQDVTTEMLRSNPVQSFFGSDRLAACLRACLDCEQACGACADACLAEQNVTLLRRCIRLNLDCADLCDAAGHVLTRQFEPDRDVLRRVLDALATACAASGAECRQHAAEHEHCRICAAACATCEQACRALLASFRADVPAQSH